VHLAAGGELDLELPATHILPLERLDEGMELMHAASEACKILLDPSA
jgi:threonine dehydrogenase-like Zn-dependent dehydrogenase